MSSVYECQLDLRTKLKIRLSSSGMQIDEARLPSGAEVKHFEIDFGQLTVQGAFQGIPSLADDAMVFVFQFHHSPQTGKQAAGELPFPCRQGSIIVVALS